MKAEVVALRLYEVEGEPVAAVAVVISEGCHEGRHGNAEFRGSAHHVPQVGLAGDNLDTERTPQETQMSVGRTE